MSSHEIFSEAWSRTRILGGTRADSHLLPLPSFLPSSSAHSLSLSLSLSPTRQQTQSAHTSRLPSPLPPLEIPLLPLPLPRKDKQSPSFPPAPPQGGRPAAAPQIRYPLPSPPHPCSLTRTLEMSHLGPPDPHPIDHLDRLPDPLLLHILNYVSDIKSLGRCSAVSRRFRLLVPLVSSVLIRVDCIISDDYPETSSPSSSSLSGATSKPSLFFVRFPLFSSLLRSFVSHLLLKPLQSLGFLSSLPKHIPNPSLYGSDSDPSSSSSSSSSVTHHSPVQVLKNFSDLRSLRIELPSGELSLNDSSNPSSSSSTLLRWRAHFGSSLDRCLILAAASHSKALDSVPGSSTESTAVDNGTIPDSFYTNGELKIRVVWTISSLIAASARHYLLQPIIAEHPTLESLVLTDADGQGVLRMDREQLEELRMKPLSASCAAKRTMVPALSMRLWYAPVLELSGGMVLKGATLVAIRPSSGEKKDAGLGWIEEAFDGEGEGMYGEAVRRLVKRRTYCLEMNSF